MTRRIFGSCYVKSTVCRHREAWKRASPAMRDQFIASGNDECVLWGEFVRTVEGRQTAKAPGSSDCIAFVALRSLLRLGRSHGRRVGRGLEGWGVPSQF